WVSASSMKGLFDTKVDSDEAPEHEGARATRAEIQWGSFPESDDDKQRPKKRKRPRQREDHERPSSFSQTRKLVAVGLIATLTGLLAGALSILALLQQAKTITAEQTDAAKKAAEEKKL